MWSAKGYSEREGGYASTKDMARQAVIDNEYGEGLLDKFERDQRKQAAKDRKKKK